MTRSVSILQIFILCLLAALVMTSCKDDVQFAAENKTTIDTMYISKKRPMADEIDSLCAVSNEQFYLDAVDSIMIARISEIETRLQSLRDKSAAR